MFPIDYFTIFMFKVFEIIFFSGKLDWIDFEGAKYSICTHKFEIMYNIINYH